MPGITEGIKRRLRQTVAYDWLLAWRYAKQLSQWTSQDQAMLEFYSHLLGAGELCFDVGANVGNRTKVFLRLGARVVAVEPQRRCARALRRGFGRDPHFVLVEAAIGASEGTAEIFLGDAHTLSSLSSEWIEAVRKSGRFADQRWERSQTVPMTTLDRLIAQHGAPAFVKVDVEGYELEVVKGLSKPVRAISLEFTPESLPATVACLEHLAQLGPIECNFSEGESMRFAFDEWLPLPALVAHLETLQRDAELFGDVYVRALR